MPRPRKKRIVEEEPVCCRFLPAEGDSCAEAVILTVDEYEALRLIDLSEMDQSGCARQMNIARTTAQSIYNSARKKIAQALVYGRELRIEGGDYVLRGTEDSFDGCCAGDRESVERIGGRSDLKTSGLESLKIAVTFDPASGDIFQHFGRTEYFRIYQIEGARAESIICSTDGQSHRSLADYLPGLGVDVLICGGIGQKAQAVLLEAGIRLYGGCSGSADDAVEAFLKNRLEYQDDIG